MKKFLIENAKVIVLHIIIFVIIYLVLPFNWIKSDIEKAYSYLFQFSAIFSAIVITAIISKVFSQRQENFKRKEEIITLSNKVSDLRRIAKNLIDSHNIWPADLKRIINSRHASLTYEILIDQTHEVGSEKAQLVDNFIIDQTFNHTIGSFFLALKSIQGDKTEEGLFLYTDHDYNYTYSIGIINSWNSFNTSNSLWYTLESEYPTINTQLHLENLEEDSISKIRQFSKKIDVYKYSDTTIPMNKLLANIGTDFDSLYLPRLFFLLYENLPILSRSLSYFINAMIAIMTFGTLLPILLQSLNIFDRFIIQVDLSLFLTCVIVFLIQFKNNLTKELEV